MSDGAQKQGFFRMLKKLDAMSWFILIATFVTSLSFLVGGVLMYISTKEVESRRSGMFYYDNYLNFSMIIPEGWQAAAPEDTDLRQIVLNVTGGVTWDMEHHRLPREVVPLALVQETPRNFHELSQEERLSNAKFMTFAFKGADSGYSYLRDHGKLQEDFKALLETLDHTNVEVVETINMGTQTNDPDLVGVLLRATAMIDNYNVNYTQYLEAAGSNILIVTYGSIYDFEDQLDDIRTILNTLVYLPGGQYALPDEKQYMQENFPEHSAELIPLNPGSAIVEIDPHDGNHDHDGDGYDDHTGEWVGEGPEPEGGRPDTTDSDINLDELEDPFDRWVPVE